MKQYNILNLAYPDQSEIKYHISRFPDGQQDVNIIDPEGLYDVAEKARVKILSRFNSFKDLEIIACATKALRRLGVNHIVLFIPYLLGARSDRAFQLGGSSYLVDVIAPFINSLQFKKVITVDVHNPSTTAACIYNLHNISNTDLVYEALRSIYPPGVKENYYLISPDSGSFSKLYKLSEEIEYNQEMIVCNKVRTTEGKLTYINVPFDLKHTNSDLIIIDDICDGGATFLNIAKEIKKVGTHKGKIYLIVTHGIFSKGFPDLEQYFDGIFCTNSVKDIQATIVKQLNVF